MNKSFFLGSVLTAFALGGAGMWLWEQRASAAAQSATAMAAVPTSQGVQVQPLLQAQAQPQVQVQPQVKTHPQHGAQPQPFGGVADPFLAMAQMQQQAMQRMRQQMQAFFDHDDVFGGGALAGNFGAVTDPLQGGFSTGLQQGEDDHSVFYTMEVGDQDVSNLNVKVENGYVSINARLSDKSANAYSQSSVAETFPIPAGVDPDSAKVDQRDHAIVIRFDKVS
ncbi:MAG: Hsp20/alpha crystallin family protein [Halioglobus sp.]